MSLLVNHDQNSQQYVLNYIAHMLHKPTVLPETIMLFKSEQGLGKDLMMDILEKLMGSQFVYRTANMDEVFGNFNDALRNK